MVYLIVKDRYKPGCYAVKEQFGQHFGEFYDSLLAETDYKHTHLQLVTLNMPSAYGEYAPYHFVDTEEEFRQKVLEMKQEILQNA